MDYSDIHISGDINCNLLQDSRARTQVIRNPLE